jgi:hypothetical protein
MAKTTAPKIHATTQKFTELVDVVDSIAILEGGNACLVIEITASNFALLSRKEQDSKIYAYAALLNSLSFPIQVIIRNKRIDITSYLKQLEEAEKNSQNELLTMHIKLYREFVREMVRVNVVLNKTFYIVIPYSSLEAGVGGVQQGSGKKSQVHLERNAFFAAAKKALEMKAESIHSQLIKLAVSARTLEKDELVKLFYDIYNGGNIEVSQVEADIKSPLIQVAKQ